MSGLWRQFLPRVAGLLTLMDARRLRDGAARLLFPYLCDPGAKTGAADSLLL